MTSPGDLRHRVTLHAIADVVGGGGEKTRTYPVISSVWAELNPSQIPVRTKADRIEFVTSYQITCPYSDNYLTTRRITFGNRTFDVQSIINLKEGNRYLVFQCEEVMG